MVTFMCTWPFLLFPEMRLFPGPCISACGFLCGLSPARPPHPSRQEQPNGGAPSFSGQPARVPSTAVPRGRPHGAEGDLDPQEAQVLASGFAGGPETQERRSVKGSESGAGPQGNVVPDRLYLGHMCRAEFINTRGRLSG